DGELRLWISLPTLEDVAVDVGETEVRLNQKGRAVVLPLPADLAKDVHGEASAKFSKKRAQLSLTWPLRPESSAYPTSEVRTKETKEVSEPSPDSSPPSDAPAFGSIWNKNSWHWEEKNCLDLATQEVRAALEKDPGWKHVPALSGVSFVMKDISVRGDASFALRKGKRILCYELSATLAWEGRDEFGCQLGVKGTAKVSGITPEDDEEAQVEIDVSASSKGGPEAKAAGSWMQGQGAKLISRALRPELLREAILAAE
ncbi:AHSA1, partial [Symbiodinium sp. CCMP2456]